MSNAASNAAAFYRQVAAEGKVWTACDAVGYFASTNSEGKSAMPFWSSLSRVQKIISTVPAYSEFEPEELSWESFRDHWLSRLKGEGYAVGVNWSGPKATGYDLEPDHVRRNVEHYLSRPDE